MANPINPTTGRPWSDQEMAYFRLLNANASDPTFADRSAKYLTHVAKPDPETGVSNYVQGADPYQVRGGIDWMQLALQQDVARQQADIARRQLDLARGNSIGWVDGQATMDEKRRQDDIRRNPMNAALYEQERRGFRSGTGNEDPLMYQKLEGDKAFTPPTQTPTPPSGGSGGKGSGGSSAPKSGGPAPAKGMKIAGGLSLKPQQSAPRVKNSVSEAFYNPNTKQYEFTPSGGGDRFSIDAATGRDLSSANAWRNTRGTGDDRVAERNTDYDKESMSRAVQDLNKRIGSLTPEAAKAYAAYDASKAAGRMDGGDVDIPGYAEGNYGFNSPEEAIAFAKAMQPAYDDYVSQVGAKMGKTGRPPEDSSTAKTLQAKFGEALRRVQALQQDIDSVQRLKKSGGDIYSEDNRQRLGRIQQLLDINAPGRKDSSLLASPSGNREADAYAGNDPHAATDFFMQEVMRMQPYGTGFTDTLNAYKPYAKWMNELYDPQVDTLSMPQFKSGGGMTLGGAPHWIVNPMGKPVAALTEDGKKERIEGKGGVEVVPLDPARNRAYEARKKKVKTNNEISRKTTLSKEVNARTKGAKPGDRRANNGKTNNGRTPPPGADMDKRANPDSDAASVRRVVRGPMMPIQTPVSRTPDGGVVGVPEGETITPLGGPMGAMTTGPLGTGMTTVPVREPNGAVMPYRPTSMGMVAPAFPVVSGHAFGALPTGAYGGLGGASNTFVKKGYGSHDDFAAIIRGEKPFTQSSVKRTSSSRTMVNGQPVNTPSMSIQPVGAPKPLLQTNGAQFDASGGNRVIGNETAPMARYGFDKNAPIDIAAHGATRGVKGMPGVQVAQPWKQAPRALMTRGTFGNQLLQSYWNATGGASEDLADRGRAAMPGSAGSQRSFF